MFKKMILGLGFLFLNHTIVVAEQLVGKILPCANVFGVKETGFEADERGFMIGFFGSMAKVSKQEDSFSIKAAYASRNKQGFYGYGQMDPNFKGRMTYIKTYYDDMFPISFLNKLENENPPFMTLDIDGETVLLNSCQNGDEEICQEIRAFMQDVMKVVIKDKEVIHQKLFEVDDQTRSQFRCNDWYGF